MRRARLRNNLRRRVDYHDRFFSGRNRRLLLLARARSLAQETLRYLVGSIVASPTSALFIAALSLGPIGPSRQKRGR